jgi:hypothetical protein
MIFQGESVHGKKMTPIVIIDPCVEIVNPIGYYCYQSIKENYYKYLSIENQFNSSVFKDTISHKEICFSNKFKFILKLTLRNTYIW